MDMYICIYVHIGLTLTLPPHKSVTFGIEPNIMGILIIKLYAIYPPRPPLRTAISCATTTTTQL